MPDPDRRARLRAARRGDGRARGSCLVALVPIRTLEPRPLSRRGRGRSGMQTRARPRRHLQRRARASGCSSSPATPLVSRRSTARSGALNPAALELLGPAEDEVAGQLDVGRSSTPPTPTRVQRAASRTPGAAADVASRSSACASCAASGERALGRGRAPRIDREPPASATSSRATSPAARRPTPSGSAQAFRDAPTGMALVTSTAASAGSTPRSPAARPHRGGPARTRRLGDRRRPRGRAQRWAASGGSRRRAALFQLEARLRRRRRPGRRDARQRDARARPARRAALLRLPVLRRHASASRPRSAGRQRGQARRGPAGRAAGQLGVGDRRRTASSGRTSCTASTACGPTPPSAATRSTSTTSTPTTARASRASSRSRSARGATSTSTTASSAPTATCA